jgi:hypothetical protein
MVTIDTTKPQNVTIRHYLSDAFRFSVSVTDQADDPVDLSEKELLFSVRNSEGGTAIATILKDTGFIIEGANNNIVTFDVVFDKLEERSYFYDLFNVTDRETIFDGELICSFKGHDL